MADRLEPAWERILKSSVVGVVIGVLLTLAAVYTLERSRAKDRDRDAERERVQAMVQIVDGLATLVYEHRTQAVLLSGALASNAPADRDALHERKSGYDAAYSNFAAHAPVSLLKLRNHLDPQYRKAVDQYFNAGIRANVDLIRTTVTDRYRARVPSATDAATPATEASAASDPMVALMQSSSACSDGVLDFVYAVAAEPTAVDATEGRMAEACGWSGNSWAVLRERANRAPAQAATR